MKKLVFAAVSAAAIVAALGLASANVAWAQGKPGKAEAMDCKGIADAKMKDECVKKSGMGADKAATAKEKGASKAMEKAGDKMPKTK